MSEFLSDVTMKSIIGDLLHSKDFECSNAEHDGDWRPLAKCSLSTKNAQLASELVRRAGDMDVRFTVKIDEMSVRYSDVV